MHGHILPYSEPEDLYLEADDDIKVGDNTLHIPSYEEQEYED